MTHSSAATSRAVMLSKLTWQETSCKIAVFDEAGFGA
jgi:hypothetical protein